MAQLTAFDINKRFQNEVKELTNEPEELKAAQQDNIAEEATIEPDGLVDEEEDLAAWTKPETQRHPTEPTQIKGVYEEEPLLAQPKADTAKTAKPDPKIAQELKAPKVRPHQTTHLIESVATAHLTEKPFRPHHDRLDDASDYAARSDTLRLEPAKLEENQRVLDQLGQYAKE